MYKINDMKRGVTKSIVTPQNLIRSKQRKGTWVELFIKKYAIMNALIEPYIGDYNSNEVKILLKVMEGGLIEFPFLMSACYVNVG